MKQPNILLITCHDLGDYLGCYGTPVGTPNIDSLSRNGVQLCNHFSTAPICSPARGSILTGCYPHTNGLMGLVHRGWELNVGQCPTIPAVLRNNGWNTALFGFQHESIEPKTLGYDEVFAGKDTHCENVVPLFEKWKNNNSLLCVYGLQGSTPYGHEPLPFPDGWLSLCRSLRGGSSPMYA